MVGWYIYPSDIFYTYCSQQKRTNESHFIELFLHVLFTSNVSLQGDNIRVSSTLFQFLEILK